MPVSKGFVGDALRRAAIPLCAVCLLILSSCSGDTPSPDNSNSRSSTRPAVPHLESVPAGYPDRGPGSRPSAETRTLNAVLREYGVTMGEIGAAPIASEFKRKGKTIGFHSLVATGGGFRVEIEITAPLSADLAERYRASKYTMVRSQYGPQRHPYPGVITNISVCPEDKKPLETRVDLLGQDTVVLLANASARFTFGVWEDDLIKHRAAFCVLYAPRTQSLFEVRIFQPHDRFDRDAVLRVLGTIRGIDP